MGLRVSVAVVVVVQAGVEQVEAGVGLGTSIAGDKRSMKWHRRWVWQPR